MKRPSAAQQTKPSRRVLNTGIVFLISLSSQISELPDLEKGMPFPSTEAGVLASRYCQVWGSAFAGGEAGAPLEVGQRSVVAVKYFPAGPSPTSWVGWRVFDKARGMLCCTAIFY